MSNRQEQFRRATEALYNGEEERAAALLADATAVDVDQVAQQLERRAATKTAVQKLLRDHPEMRDPDFAFIVDRHIGARELQRFVNASAPLLVIERGLNRAVERVDRVLCGVTIATARDQRAVQTARAKRQRVA